MAGCGKKGPPLAPFVRIPQAVDQLASRRVGDDVYLTMRVPAANLDASAPAVIARIQVYALTALTPPPRARFLDFATPIGEIPVAPAGDPADRERAAPDPRAGGLQGATVTFRERLTPEAFEPVVLPSLSEGRAPAGAAVPPPPQALRRFYLAVPFPPRGPNGPPSEIVEQPLTALPPPPDELRAEWTAAAATLTWEPSGGLLGWLLDQAPPVEPPPFPLAPLPAAAAAATPLAELPAGPTRYHVYRQLAPDPLLLPAAAADRPWQAAPPAPLTAAPQPATTFSDPIALDERPRCYEVRSVRGEPGRAVEGPPSPRVCLTPVDIYPPEPPGGLATVAAGGLISLVWTSNREPDLGGYLVLRREAGGDRLLQLTPAPISEPRYDDRDVRPGQQYVYAVVAVDSRVPLPNVSAPSVEVTETAR